MIFDLPWPDALRYLSAFWASVGCILLTTCAVFSADRDQASRFGVLLGYDVVAVAGQLQALGRPGTWVTVLLALVVAATNFVAGRYLARTLPGALRGDHGGR